MREAPVIRAGRLVLRAPEARDRAAFVALSSSPEVRRFEEWGAEQGMGVWSPAAPPA
ncbi:hypothetical protein DUI70_3020 [Streptomyces albus]|nr:hypothetical protein DUI70_3020 [Streptomyces albus]